MPRIRYALQHGLELVFGDGWTTITASTAVTMATDSISPGAGVSYKYRKGTPVGHSKFKVVLI